MCACMACSPAIQAQTATVSQAPYGYAPDGRGLFLPAPPAWDPTVIDALYAQWSQTVPNAPALTASNPLLGQNSIISENGYYTSAAGQAQTGNALMQSWLAYEKAGYQMLMGDGNPSSSITANSEMGLYPQAQRDALMGVASAAYLQYMQQWQKLTGQTLGPNGASSTGSGSSSGNALMTAIGLLAGMLAGAFGAPEVQKLGQAVSGTAYTVASANTQSLNAYDKVLHEDQKNLVSALTTADYAAQTAPVAQLPAPCSMASAAQAAQESMLSSTDIGAGNESGAVANLGLGNGAVASNGEVAMNSAEGYAYAAHVASAALSADALYTQKGASRHSQTFMQLLASPTVVEPLPIGTDQTPAGVNFQALYAIASARMGIAMRGLGDVAAMQSANQPATSASAVAASVAASSPAVQQAATAATSTQASSASSASASSGSTSTPSAGPTGGSTAWESLTTPDVVKAIKTAAAQYNINPNFLGAIMTNESRGRLNALAYCGTTSGGNGQYQAVASTFRSMPTVICRSTSHPNDIWSAKSLFQFVDKTYTEYGQGSPLLATQNAQAEANAGAAYAASLAKICNGDYACMAVGWNVGAGGAMAYAQGGPDAVIAKYPTFGASAINNYLPAFERAFGGPSSFDASKVPSSSGSASGSGNTSSGAMDSASASQLLALMATGTFANPDWYRFLDQTNQAGLWRAIIYMTTIAIEFNQQKMRLLQDLVAIEAAELSRTATQSYEPIAKARAQSLAQSIMP